jgi:two-component system, chemotaxis family, chemotaxis protein CheY
VEAADAVRVLLIEDDSEFAEMYRLALEADQYVVEWAPDPEHGMALAVDWQPDLIFLDVRMPQMDGLELLRRLRDGPETSELPVVVLSNYSDEDLRRQSRELGALDWIVKIETTPKAVATWIERWSAAQVAEG